MWTCVCENTDVAEWSCSSSSLPSCPQTSVEFRVWLLRRAAAGPHKGPLYRPGVGLAKKPGSLSHSQRSSLAPPNPEGQHLVCISPFNVLFLSSHLSLPLRFSVLAQWALLSFYFAFLGGSDISSNLLHLLQVYFCYIMFQDDYTKTSVYMPNSTGIYLFHVAPYYHEVYADKKGNNSANRSLSVKTDSQVKM